jgi:hypothetical protein
VTSVSAMTSDSSPHLFSTHSSPHVFGLYFVTDGVGPGMQNKMESGLVSPRGNTNDEMPMEKNAGLIMGVSRASLPVQYSCQSNFPDQQQQHRVQEKCREALPPSTALLSLLCPEAYPEISYHQPRILASNESHRLGSQAVP